MNASAAEEFCVNQGGHLASVGSEEEQDELEKVGGYNDVWLGGRRKTGKDDWEWLDGRPWGYKNWFSWPEYHLYEPKTDPGHNCMYLETYTGKWYSSLCDKMKYFLCVNLPVKMSGNKTRVFKNAALVNQTFNFWWNQSEEDTQGFELSWQIENGSLPDVRELVSQDLEGSVSTPGLGSLPPPNYYKERHEYTAVIELPRNITEVIGDGALVIRVSQKKRSSKDE